MIPSGTLLRAPVVLSSTMPFGSTPSRCQSPAADRWETADWGPAQSCAACSFCSHEEGVPDPGLQQLIPAQGAILASGEPPELSFFVCMTAIMRGNHTKKVSDGC